jgi:hypothetical protein
MICFAMISHTPASVGTYVHAVLLPQLSPPPLLLFIEKTKRCTATFTEHYIICVCEITTFLSLVL